MRINAIHNVGWMALALSSALVAAPATAQNSAGYEITVHPLASPPSKATGELAPPAAVAPVADESALPGDALIFDPATLAVTTPAKPLHLPSLSDPKALDVSRTGAPDGSGPVVVKQPLPTEWDTSVGADIGLASAPPTSFRPPMPGTRDSRGSGAGWVQVGVPNLATVDARVDPSHDQGKLGTTFKQSIGNNFSVTLQNNYSVTETNGLPPAAPSDFPLMTAPRAPVTATPPPQIWGKENLAKLDFLPTGTSLAAGLSTASNDPVTHNKLSADQRLYGPLHVTTAVTDVGQPNANKSITAGLRLNW